MRSRIIAAKDAGDVAEIQWPSIGEINPAPAGIALPAPRQPAEAAAEQTEARLQAAFEEGYRKGHSDALAKSQVETDSRLAALARGIEVAAGMKARLRAEAERDVVELALAIARRVLRRQLLVDPEALLGLVKAAFEGIALSEVTEVRAAPTMEPLLRRHLEAIGAPQAIRVACDASLGAGGLEVDTLRGTLDASVDTQLDEIGRGLADLMPPARVRS